MKLSDIKPKYLVLGQDYNDFALATDKVNFDEEDLCCQLVSLTSVYYWINTESVWGPIGFNWDLYNNYGSFTISSLNYTIIPKIPDSNRHLRLYNIFYYIYRDLTFLDSDWSHIINIELLGRSNYNLHWIANSLSNINNVIQYQSYKLERYSIIGNLNNTTVYNQIILTLLPENKDNLNLDLIGNRANGWTTYFTINCKNINEDVIDLTKYVKFRPYDKMYSLYITGFNCKKLIIESVTNYSINTSQSSHYFGNSLSGTCTDELVVIFNNTIGPNNNNIIQNNITIYVKKFTYINLLNNGKYSKINNFYRRGDFQNETPQITDEIIKFTYNSVFYECYFYKKYKYGKLKCSTNIFMSCKIKDYKDDEIHDVYSYDIFNSSFKVGGNICDVFKYFDFEYDTSIRDIGYPTFYSDDGYIAGWYDLKTDMLNCSKYHNTNNSFTSIGIMYFKESFNKLLLSHRKDCIIIKNECTFNFRYNNNSSVYFDDNNVTEVCINFETNSNNIVECHSTFNNGFIVAVYKRFNKIIPYIYRDTDINIPVEDTKDPTIYLNYFLPQTEDIVIAYKINVYIFNKKHLQSISNARVQNILDSITTIGDSSDASNYTIKLLSTYYQNIKEETKNKLIGDGYTIIEVL